MAKIRKNIIIQGFSGTLGDQLVVKQDKAGRTILAVPPTVDPNRTFSEAQQAQHEKFREAATYAKDAKSQDVYQDKAEGTPQTPYNDLKVRVGLAFYTRDNNIPADRYREFWIDTPEGIFARLGI